MKCLQLASDLMVVVDTFENAQALNHAAATINMTLSVLIDIDPGVHRSGVPYDQALPLANKINQLENLTLHGIQCYAGNLQHIKNFNERKKASQTVMQKAVNVAQQFKEKGLCCDILTGTGTGTYNIERL